MGLSKIEVALVCLVSTSILAHLAVQAQSPQDYLDPHNAARAQVGVGALVWDDTVAATALNYAYQRAGDCSLVHSGNPNYGENLAMSTGSLSPAEAVKLWTDEQQYYDYNSNTCIGGVCGHYTQVVWANSLRLGCASVTCNSGGTFVICNYYPPGNHKQDISLVDKFVEFLYWIADQIVTSNKPYSVSDGSNPFFDGRAFPKFNLRKSGVHSGHVQKGLLDPFCFVPNGKGKCQVTNVGSEPFPQNVAGFNFTTQFPHYKEVIYKPDFGRKKLLKPVVFDMDMSSGDFLALIYILKVHVEVIDLKVR
ncbi:hypothetical protein Scep_001277 [Stephania cephalantha]|uniref:SCP domain-containing protein n=1 Tax=Stephania cephalantha TaxID=152367 RepID=A0AAP0L7V6_9MAGN